MKRIRIKDIAQQANVSIGTVDRVLHNRGEVAPPTKKKILTIAKELNYQPNIVAQALTSKKIYHLAVLIPTGDRNNVFWLAHPKGIKQAVQELQPFAINVQYHLFELHNEADFLEKSESLLQSHPDGVIMAPILKKEALHFCKKMDDQKIPYIFIDTFIDHTNCISFIGEDAFRGGRIGAGLINFGLPVGKDVLIVNIVKDIENTQHLNKRNQGFMSFFSDSAKNQGTILSVEIPGTGRQVIEEKMNQIIEENQNLGAILVSSSKTHVIARYLEQKKFNPILIGYEITPQNTDYLKKGIIDFLIGQKPMEQSEKAVKRLFEYLTSHTISQKHEFQPLEIINSETIAVHQNNDF